MYHLPILSIIIQSCTIFSKSTHIPSPQTFTKTWDSLCWQTWDSPVDRLNPSPPVDKLYLSMGGLMSVDGAPNEATLQWYVVDGGSHVVDGAPNWNCTSVICSRRGCLICRQSSDIETWVQLHVVDEGTHIWRHNYVARNSVNFSLQIVNVMNIISHVGIYDTKRQCILLSTKELHDILNGIMQIDSINVDTTHVNMHDKNIQCNLLRNYYKNTFCALICWVFGVRTWFLNMFDSCCTLQIILLFMFHTLYYCKSVLHLKK